MVNSPVDSSIRSRHTGHVGSSMRAGVGGAIGFVFRDVEGIEDDCPFAVKVVVLSIFAFDGVKGSFVMSGKELACPVFSSARNSMDLTNTTWQFSGY